MAYRITFRQGKRIVCAKAWPCELQGAISHAKAQFPIQHSQHGVTSVNIICERTGEEVFSFARHPEAAGS